MSDSPHATNKAVLELSGDYAEWAQLSTSGKCGDACRVWVTKRFMRESVRYWHPKCATCGHRQSWAVNGDAAVRCTKHHFNTMDTHGCLDHTDFDKKD